MSTPARPDSSGVLHSSGEALGDLVAAMDDAPARSTTTEAAGSGATRVNETGEAAPFARNAMVYAVATILSRATAFIMLPVYTRVLLPADYGLLQMLDMAVDVTAIMVSAGSMAGVMRFAFKAESKAERESVIATAFLLIIGLQSLGAVLLAAVAVPVWHHFLGSAGAAWYVRIAAANFATGAILVVPLMEMEIRGCAKLFAVTSLGKLMLQVSLNLLFLIGMHSGPIGILFSTLIANVVIGSAASVWLFRTNRFRLSHRAVRDLYRFGFPYQLATAGAFVLTFGDRFFLQPARGLAAVGIYSFAYQFGFLMSTIGPVPYRQAWTPHRFELLSLPKQQRDHRYNVGLFYFTLVTLTVSVGVGVLVHPALRIMSKVDYLPAADLVPIILAAYVVQAWGAEAQFGIDVSEKTRYSTYATWISVVTVLVLYVVLIPPFGAWGAAIATLISFCVRSLLLYIYAQRVWPIAYRWGAHLRLTLIACAAVGASYLVRAQSLQVEIAAMCALLVMYFAAVWGMALTGEQRTEIGAFAAEKRATILALLARA